MRESIVQREKAGSSVSIPALKQPTRGFGLDLLNASPAAATQAQPINKPITHDISRISFRRPQAKLTIGQPGDVYEQEADSVAQQVMQRMALSGNRQSIQRQEAPEEEEELQMKPLEISTLQRQEAPEEEEELQMKSLDTSTLQRQEAPEEEEELQMSPMVQRKGQGGMAATPDLETSINQARGGGQPLGDNIRKPMEQAFSADFGGVKVHTDSRSDQLNQSIQARAFTTGQDVFFRQGEYNPGSREGQELLAHELTHVVQQSGGVMQRSMSLKTVESVQGKQEKGIIQCGQVSSRPTVQPKTELELVGIQHENGKSYAFVQAKADLTDISQRVYYDIKWDANVVPGGQHLGQTEGQASDWVEDLSPRGQSIGDRDSEEHKYFNEENESDKKGLKFRFNDGIEQRELNGGSWWFRIRVVSANGEDQVISMVKVDWTH